MTRHILFILNQSPYGSSRALESVEAALMAGLLEQDVSLLFKGDGLYLLLTDQQGPAIGQRSLAKVLTALPDYDISRFHACQMSAAERRLLDADLCLPVTWLDAAGQRALIEQQNVIAC